MVVIVIKVTIIDSDGGCGGGGDCFFIIYTMLQFLQESMS